MGNPGQHPYSRQGGMVPLVVPGSLLVPVPIAEMQSVSMRHALCNQD